MNTMKLSNDFLDKSRQASDQQADAIIEKLFREDQLEAV